MSTLVDYVRESTDTFSERAATHVDALVFAALAYARFAEDVEAARSQEGISLRNACATGSLVLDDELLLACALSPRFAPVMVSHAVCEGSIIQEKQFAAVTFTTPSATFVVFRGTDDTLIGWKEDFNLVFSAAVPAQISALTYLEDIAAVTEGELWTCGHSKGGNLAVYAYMTASDAVRDRVATCISFDGPGFSEACTADPSWSGDYTKVERIVPEESIIGMLFGGLEPEPLVVRSTYKGVLQHAPKSWVIQDNDFAYVAGVSYAAYRTQTRVNAWAFAMDAAERERFVEVLWRVIQASGEATFSGLVSSLRDGSLELMLRRMQGLPADDRRFFIEQLEKFTATMILGSAPVSAVTPTERADAAAMRVADASAKFNDRLARLEGLTS